MRFLRKKVVEVKTPKDTFNSLYEIRKGFVLRLLDVTSALSILFMRFSAWTASDAKGTLNTFNSLYEIPRDIDYGYSFSIYYFQFSLWDSSKEETEKLLASLPLSILFMRFSQAGNVGYLTTKLSILFMRFYDVHGPEGWRHNSFQFSLWDSLCFQQFLLYLLTLLSILFMRFRKRK